jgi:alkanesulfonate monooxygenase SsuD/methylene tetrahydromethanopterin reductase-like flavin-dependent oxidoreductase (luciferase family)
MTYLQTSGYNAKVRDTLNEGQKLILIQPCLVEPDPEKARKIARRAISIYRPLANYRRAWKAQGFKEPDYSNGGSDDLVDSPVAWGSVEAVRQRLDEHRALGVDQVVIIPLNMAGRGRPDIAAICSLTET